MASKEISLGSSPVDFPGYPSQGRDENNKWRITERYWIKDDAVAHSLPAHNATVNQHGDTVEDLDGNTLKCRLCNISPGQAPGVLIVELAYATTESTLSFKSPPDNPRTVGLTSEDIPIDDEKLLVANGGPLTADQIKKAKSRGFTSFALFSMEYTYTELNASFTWTEADIVAALQTTGAPTGMVAATAEHWELTGREIDETDEETVIRSHYRYAKAGVLPL